MILCKIQIYRSFWSLKFELSLPVLFFFGPFHFQRLFRRGYISLSFFSISILCTRGEASTNPSFNISDESLGLAFLIVFLDVLNTISSFSLFLYYFFLFFILFQPNPVKSLKSLYSKSKTLTYLLLIKFLFIFYPLFSFLPESQYYFFDLSERAFFSDPQKSLIFHTLSNRIRTSLPDFLSLSGRVDSWPLPKGPVWSFNVSLCPLSLSRVRTIFLFLFHLFPINSAHYFFIFVFFLSFPHIISRTLLNLESRNK